MSHQIRTVTRPNACLDASRGALLVAAWLVAGAAVGVAHADPRAPMLSAAHGPAPAAQLDRAIPAPDARAARLPQPGATPDFPSPLVQVQGPESLVGIAVELDADLIAAMAETPRFFVRDFALEGGDLVDLELEPFSVFAENAQRVFVDEGGVEIVREGAPGVSLFRGSVVGAKASTVFFALGEHGANGFVDIGGEVHVLASGPYGSGLPHAMYNLTALPDGVIIWNQFVCGLDRLLEEGHVPAELPDDGAELDLRDSACRIVRMAVDSDWIYTRDLFGSNPNAAEAYIATLMGAVSEIYTRDVDTGFEVVFTRTFGSNNSPYNSNDIYNALGTLGSVFRNELSYVDRDLAHLFSGRRYSGAAGVAYLSAMCNTNIGYGVSGYLEGTFPYPLQNNNSQNWDLIVVAHEIGHNLGTGHTHDAYNPVIDGCGNGDCSSAFGGTIMSYCHTCPGGTSNLKVEFHPRVQQRISSYLSAVAASNNCTADIVINPPSVTLQPDDQEVYIGFDAQLTAQGAGAAPFTYQWRRDGQPIPGANEPTLNIIAAQPEDAGVYDCVLSTACSDTYTLPATLTVLGTDCTGSGLDDTYEIQTGIEQDCNNNGVPDSCDLVGQHVFVQSPRYEPLDRNHPRQLYIGNITKADTNIVIHVEGRGDIGGLGERIAVRYNGFFLGWLFGEIGDAVDCNLTFDTDTLVISKSVFNAIFPGGDLTLDLIPSNEIVPDFCSRQSYFQVTVEFTQQPVSTDSTGDGVPDDCAPVEACSVADLTGPALDGVPDGLVTTADLNFFLAAWIADDVGVADLTGPALDGVPDGLVTTADLNYYVSAWLEGCD
ncbi:MAG: hypothetical protein EA378_00505 [Phycisphaerales bacterium]|nr:MAG: hypothetical protein EA378_00505 [Phycisphaerales bacterium]